MSLAGCFPFHFVVHVNIYLELKVLPYDQPCGAEQMLFPCGHEARTPRHPKSCTAPHSLWLGRHGLHR